MSVSGIINPITNKIYDILVPQGGGVPLVKGQIITADGNNVEVAFPTVPPANGSVLSYNSNEPFGLKYIPSSSIEIDYQELLSSNSSNVPTVITPPPQNGYVLTANTSPSNPTGLAWEAVGGTGKITATLPLVEEAVNGASNLYINFTGNVVGEIPYGNGTAKTGALTNAPTAGQILGISNGVPTWVQAPTNVDTIVYRNSVDNSPLPISKPLTANSTCVITADRTNHTYSVQEKNTPLSGGTNVDATGNNLVFFEWTPTTSILITSMSINVYVVSNAQIPAQLNNNGDCSMYDNAGTTLLLESTNAEWGIINAGLVNFTQQGAPFETVPGTTYKFIFSCTLNSQAVNPTCDLVNVNPLGLDFVGNLTINGVEYDNIPASFVLPPPYKFRQSGVSPLTSYTSVTAENYSSQSFVSSGDTNDWIMVGERNGGIAFVP